ncbi:MAG TPA: hypothetical protein VEL69_02425 [Ktedonobacteraceae bacterium]|nr:hypothetical protein [Ktedonobacteraceae bacterium]
MGQYQQWLHCREVDQQSHTELETLERELAQLLDGAQPVEQPEQPLQDAVFSAVQIQENTAFDCSFPADNTIILALATGLNGPAPSSPYEHPSSPGPANQHIPAAGQAAETISSALFAWSNLPNFETPNLPTASPMNGVPQFNPNLNQHYPHISHQDLALLPEDMSSFIDEHSLTDPRIELPWWLHNITAPSGANNSNRPIDQESIRTNRLVNRWLERWGHQPTPQNSRGENNHE